MRNFNRWKLTVVFVFLILGATVSAQNSKIDSLKANQSVRLNSNSKEGNLKVPERAVIDMQNKELVTIPIWKVSTRPKFNGPVDLSAFISDQIIEIENVFGEKIKSGQAIYEVCINTKGVVDELKPTVSSGEYLDNCFIAAIMETSGNWVPAIYNDRVVRTNIKIKIQYRLEWFTTWTKLLITAHEVK